MMFAYFHFPKNLEVTMKTISFVLSILLTFAAFNKHVHAYEYCGYKWASVPVTYEI